MKTRAMSNHLIQLYQQPYQQVAFVFEKIEKI